MQSTFWKEYCSVHPKFSLRAAVPVVVAIRMLFGPAPMASTVGAVKSL